MGIIKHLALLLVYVVVYLFFSFVAWDFNPLHWWLITSTFGRIVFGFIIFGLLQVTAEYYEEF